MTVQEWVSVIPRPVPEVYRYFSDPYRLDGFTPPFLRLKLLTAPDRELVPGQVMDYTLGWHKLAFFWRTRIEEVEVNRRFVDSQLVGPYRHFRHVHEFHAIEEGTLMVDRLEWSLPLGPLGWLADVLLVRPSLEEIFRHRRAHALRELVTIP